MWMSMQQTLKICPQYQDRESKPVLRLVLLKHWGVQYDQRRADANEN